MGVTRWLLIVFGVTSCVCGLYVYMVEVVFSAYGAEWTPVSISVVAITFIKMITIAVLAWIAVDDLKKIDGRAQEYFRLNAMGCLGWIGLLFIASAVWFLHLNLQNDFPMMHFEERPWWRLLAMVALDLERFAHLALIGAVCLYARFRIAANKRLEVV